MGMQDGGADGPQLIHNCGLVGIDSGSSSEHYFAAMKKLLFLVAYLVALASQPVMAQTGGPSVVVVQLYQSGFTKYQIVIDRGGDTPEVVEFKADPQIKQAGVYQHIFEKLAQEGYVIQSTFSLIPNSTTLVFGKK
jgi:hypothetical protein